MDDVQVVFDMFMGLLLAGRTPEQAEQSLLATGVAPELVGSATQLYRETAERIIAAREPDSLVDPARIVPWYTGPRPADTFWPAVRRFHGLRSFPTDALRSLDVASTRVVAHLPPPWKTQFSGRGLVLGYVQSGKTSNFTAAIAKAADAGYRLFVVMSGLHNNLRRQTQIRLTRELVDLNPDRWIQLTDEDRDFGNPGNADALLSQTQLRLLAVVKKNKIRLANLLRWLDSAHETARANCPVLVIDDEADQASVNTSDVDDPSVINALVRQILQLPKVAYVGYTATPFANVFIDPTVDQDLYPRDFIIDLPRPAGYFGPERIFGRQPLHEDDEPDDGLDMIRFVPDDEIPVLRPPRGKVQRDSWDPDITPSLEEAIRWFVLATAARRARGQLHDHSSMLVHTTQYASIHERFRAPLEGEIASLRVMVDRGETGDLEKLWQSETGRVPAVSVGESPVSFADLAPHLTGVLRDVRLVVDNYLSDERLDYGSDPQTVIVIGGNTLSRGLTLEGLVVSYFLRTSTAYDTLMQMARWFGYRHGFSDLPRIWMTPELAEYFHFLATVEAEIRTDILRYEAEDRTPLEFAVRVRTHPELAVTSALKMQAARTCHVSYSGRRLQTILFEHRDRGWLEANLEAARTLVSSAASGVPVENRARGRWLLRGIEVALVRSFLCRYHFHPDAQDLVADRLLKYIDDQNRHGDLLTWNIAVMGRDGRTGKSIDVGLPDGRQVGLINRAAIRGGSKPHANIKSLMSRVDRVIDLDLPEDEVRQMNDAQLQSKRPLGTGLLLLYPIDKDSVPRSAKNRVPLNAVEHMIGVGLVFPDAAKKETTVTYLSVELPPGAIDEPEDGEFSDTEPDLDDVRR